MESWSGAIEWHVGVAFWGGFKFLLPIPLFIKCKRQYQLLQDYLADICDI